MHLQNSHIFGEIKVETLTLSFSVIILKSCAIHFPLQWLHLLQLPHKEVIQYFKHFTKQPPVIVNILSKFHSKEFYEVLCITYTMVWKSQTEKGSEAHQQQIGQAV